MMIELEKEVKHFLEVKETERLAEEYANETGIKIRVKESSLELEQEGIRKWGVHWTWCVLDFTDTRKNLDEYLGF